MVTRQSASMEDYLEAITVLSEGEKPVSVTQVSKALQVRKPSVTSALKRLSQDGLVKHERYGYVELTARGEEIARDVFRRHKALQQFLAEILKVDPKIASDDACRMEHSISPVTFEKLAKFVQFVLTCPQGEPECLKGFNYYLEHGKRAEEYLARCQRDNK